MTRGPTIRFRIDFAENLHIGPGKIALLEAIEHAGSLNKAAVNLKLSYRRAWLLLDSLNKTFDEPVVKTVTGGKHGGGSEVTEFGRLLLKSYRRMENAISGIAGDCLKEVLPRLSQHAMPDIHPTRQRLARKLGARSAGNRRH